MLADQSYFSFFSDEKGIFVFMNDLRELLTVVDRIGQHLAAKKEVTNKLNAFRIKFFLSGLCLNEVACD